jgi:hypothetical protein
MNPKKFTRHIIIQLLESKTEVFESNKRKATHHIKVNPTSQSVDFSAGTV